MGTWWVDIWWAHGGCLGCMGLLMEGLPIWVLCKVLGHVVLFNSSSYDSLGARFWSWLGAVSWP